MTGLPNTHRRTCVPGVRKGRLAGLARENDLLEVTPSQATLLSRHEMSMPFEKVTVRAVVKVPPATVAHDMSLKLDCLLLVGATGGDRRYE